MGDFQTFIKAVEDGNLEYVRNSFQADFLEKTTDPDYMDMKPIHLACWHGKLEVAKFLFENQCRLECENKNQWRPIHFACVKGNLEVVKFLFENKCSLECENKNKRRPIHLACENGHLEVVKFLFQNECSLECEDEDKLRPIHLACGNGDLDIVKFFFENKSSIECEDKYKMRPIHLACWSGNHEIMMFLIQSKCEIDCKTKAGETPAQMAANERHETCKNFMNEVLERKKIFKCVQTKDVQAFGALYNSRILMMDDYETDISLLEFALESKSCDIIDYIFNKSVTAEEVSALENHTKKCCRLDAVDLIRECLIYRSIRFHDADGFHLSCSAKTINEHGKLVKPSFLEVAAEFGCKAFINSILKKSIYNDVEWTKAKDLAIVKGHTEIAEAISSRISLLRKRADKKFTWLHSAVCDNDPDMVKYILEKDLVNPNSNNEVVGTALALAHMMSYEECIKMLEKFNVDVNTQNKYSQSPLHEAIDSGMTDHCSYLISRANDIDIPGFMGFSGLQCAVIEGCEKLCEDLMQNGANCLGNVEILHQPAFINRGLPISKSENAVTLCAKIHQKIFPCFLQELNSDKFKCSDVQSVMTSEIFHLVIPDGDTKIILSLFEKCSPKVQQSVIEDLLHHFVSTDNYNDFVNLLNTEIAEPRLFPNGETLLTNLLNQSNLDYSLAIINCVKNKKYIVSPNAINATPLQKAIELELFDLLIPIILNCDDQRNLDSTWHIPLILLFQKLSMSTNNDMDEKLLRAIREIKFKGGDIYKTTSRDIPIINFCTRFREEIEKF